MTVTGDPVLLLPHRPPFRFVDAVDELVPGERVLARYRVTGEEAFLAGHFPGNPVFPGCCSGRWPRPAPSASCRWSVRGSLPLFGASRGPLAPAGDTGRRDGPGRRAGAVGPGRLGLRHRHRRRQGDLPGPPVLRAGQAVARPWTPPPRRSDQAPLDLAVTVAREAGAAARLVRVPGPGRRRQEATPVTAADRTAERLVREALPVTPRATACWARRSRRRPGGRAAAGSSTPSTAPRASPGASPSTRPCWPWTTSTARRSASSSSRSTRPSTPAAASAAGRPPVPARVSTTPAVDGAYLMSSSYSHWRRGPAGGEARERGAADLGRRLRLRPGGHRPGRRHGGPHRRALRRGRHAGDPGRGRRAPSWPASPAPGTAAVSPPTACCTTSCWACCRADRPVRSSGVTAASGTGRRTIRPSRRGRTG